jgi:hypothetical protein
MVDKCCRDFTFLDDTIVFFVSPRLVVRKCDSPFMLPLRPITLVLSSSSKIDESTPLVSWAPEEALVRTHLPPKRKGCAVHRWERTWRPTPAGLRSSNALFGAYAHGGSSTALVPTSIYDRAEGSSTTRGKHSLGGGTEGSVWD